MSGTPRPGPSSASHAARRRRDGLTLLHRLAQQSQEPQTQAEPRVLSSTHGSFLPTDSEACMTSQPPGWRTRQHTESYFKRVAPVSAENYSDFSSPPPPHPAVRFKAAAEDPATERSMGKCPSRPSDAPKCSGVGGCPKASSQFLGLEELRLRGGPASCPAVPRNTLYFLRWPPLLSNPSPPGRVAPRYLQQSQARPRSALQNLNPYCGLPPARASTTARLRGAGAGVPAPVAAQHSRYGLQRVWSRDGAEWAVCGQTLGPGGGSAEAKPAPVARPPPARACTRG